MTRVGSQRHKKKKKLVHIYAELVGAVWMWKYAIPRLLEIIMFGCWAER